MLCICMPKSDKLLTETLPVDRVRTLLGDQGGSASAPALRDRLIKVAGDRKMLVELMDAVNGLNS